MGYSDLLDIAKTAALQAGAAIMEVYHSDEFGEELKQDRSPVTKADKAAHFVINHILAQTDLPVLSEEGRDIPFEERNKWKKFWLIDPLDGTKEFIKRNGEFTVNIALIEAGRPIVGVIYSPGQDLMYLGGPEKGVVKIERGKEIILPVNQKKVLFDELLARNTIGVVASRSHMSAETENFIKRLKNVRLEQSGSALKFMALAEGKADVYPRFSPTMEWDTAAAHAILNIAGAGVYQTDLRSQLVYNKPSLVNPSFIAF